MPFAGRRLDDRFSSGVVRAATPIALWGVHFFSAYWVVQFACRLGLEQYAVFGLSWISVALVALTLAAISVLMVMIVLDGRRLNRQGARDHREGLLMFVQVGTAIFALVGVLWSTVPILVAAPCANLYQLKGTSSN
jgi:hypothetical protein